MPPRAGRPRNTNHETVNSPLMGQPDVLEGPSGFDYSNVPPMGEPIPRVHQQVYPQNYAPMEPQLERQQVGERPFIPDIAVSILEDPRSKAVLKGSLSKLTTEVASGARLEDDAAELLLYVANDFLSNLANFSCRLASHRGSENLDTRDVELYLERMHGMHVSLVADSPLPVAPSLPPPSAPLVDPTPYTSAAPTPIQRREPSPPLAQTRPRRHTNAMQPDTSAQDENEDEEDDDDDESGGDNAEEAESDEEKPRESRRLRERAVVVEKQKRGKRGRPRKG